jgi:hypothetical protein
MKRSYQREGRASAHSIRIVSALQTSHARCAPSQWDVPEPAWILSALALLQSGRDTGGALGGGLLRKQRPPRGSRALPESMDLAARSPVGGTAAGATLLEPTPNNQRERAGVEGCEESF